MFVSSALVQQGRNAFVTAHAFDMFTNTDNKQTSPVPPHLIVHLNKQSYPLGDILR